MTRFTTRRKLPGRAGSKPAEPSDLAPIKHYSDAEISQKVDEIERVRTLSSLQQQLGELSLSQLHEVTDFLDNLTDGESDNG